MMKTILKNAQVISPYRVFNGGVVIVDDRIDQVFEGEIPEDVKFSLFDGDNENAQTEGLIVDLEGQYLVPGFIEMHSHGGGGYDVMDGTGEDIAGAAKLHLQHGTTTYVPTSMSCKGREIYQMIDSFRQVKDREDLPYLPGIHLEGPYLSPSQTGAQNPDCLVWPDPAEYMDILDYANGDIVRWSAAPEIKGGYAFGRELARRGILASIAHSDATYEQVLTAMENGYSHVTHLYSSTSTVKRINAFRHAGIIEAAFLEDGLDVEIIADGKHLPASLLKLIYKIKGPDHIALVTDSLRAAGSTSGTFRSGSAESGITAVIEDGVAFIPDHTAFAGSIATGDRLIRTMVNLAQVSLENAIRMITATPARMLGIDDMRGSITQGKIADLVVLNKELQVTSIYLRGRKQTW